MALSTLGTNMKSSRSALENKLVTIFAFLLACVFQHHGAVVYLQRAYHVIQIVNCNKCSSVFTKKNKVWCSLAVIG